MKTKLYRFLSCALFIAAAVSAWAENGIKETRNYTICPGDTMRLSTRVEVVYNATILYDTLIVASPNEDSIIAYVVNVYPPFAKDEYRRLSVGESYVWQDTTITDPGLYERVYHSVEGCDSIYRLHVTQVIDSALTFTICEGESVLFNGRTYSNAGTYTDLLSGDTVYTITIVKHPSREFVQTGILDSPQPYYWQYTQDGEPKTDTIYEPGRYVHTTHNPETGCNDVWILNLTKNEAQFHFIETATICENEEFNWRGQLRLNKRGVGQTNHYFDRYRSVTDQDSIYELILTVRPAYAASERITFLQFPTTYRGQEIPGPGTYVFNYQSTYGCDSIITTYINLDVYRDEQTATICPGESYIWSFDGETYTVKGTYTKTELDQYGNDSVTHVLHLNIPDIPAESYMEETICQGQSYVFGDQTLTQSGIYRHTFHKDGGCDSVVVLSLNVARPDTTYLAIQRRDGDSYVWDGETIQKPGMYFHYGTNRFGCDSVSILNYTYNQVDTIVDTVTVCQNELPYLWNGIEGNQTKTYTKLVQQPSGTYIFYSLALTVRPVVTVDTAFAICAGGTIQFNGETYNAAGYYRTYLNCDTLVNVQITIHQPVVYETQGTITDDHGFTWSFIDHGTPQTMELILPGTYEYENPNGTTGCNDIYRLILTQDETSYHFEESQTICEGEDFEWHGMRNLGLVTGTKTYEDRYVTRAGKDSIYTLVLTVTPIERTVRTITFCGSIEWEGKTYTEDAIVYDTLSLPTGCYRIERVNLDKAKSYYHTETRELPQGTILIWHGQNITTDGTYYDYGTTVNGCDSIYEINVTIIPAVPQTNQYAEELSTCEGDTILWRGKDIWRSGVYVDTVRGAGQTIDSIFTLTFTAWPAPKDTIIQHLYTCANDASIRYNGQDYYTDQTVITNFKTIHNCDSIVKVFLHFNTALDLSRIDTIADTQLPYTWTYQLNDIRHDTILTTSGTYTHIVSSEGGCTHREELVLVVLPTYLYELDTTICETALPFEWRGKQLQHTIGETKQYEDALKTVNKMDSIYRINLTIVAAPRRTERISICENKDTLINGKSYFDPTLYIPGVVYHDTAYKHYEGNECDSIIYYEISKTPQRHIIETRIMHEGETFEWHGQTIEDFKTWTYTIEDEIDPTTNCEIIYQLRVIAENRKNDAICVTDLPYQWEQTGKEYFTTGMYTDTIRDAEGKITEFHTLNLRVDTIQKLTEHYYVCYGYPENIYGKIYGNDPTKTDYIDEFQQEFDVPGSKCKGELTVFVTVSSSKQHTQTVVLLEGETLDWNKYHIIQGGEYRDTTMIADGCDSISILRVVQEQRKVVTICKIDTGETVHPDKRYPYQWEQTMELYNTSGIYTDTVWDAEHYMTEFHTLYLTITQPYDTTVYVHGCQERGIVWRDHLYTKDTTFVQRIEVNPFTPEAPCDSVFHVTIDIDTTYSVMIDTVLREYELPLIIGRQLPDTIWEEGTFIHPDYTSCGCDSVISVNLHIIPKLTKNDSTFICEDEIKEHPVYLGDTINPWFSTVRDGQYDGTWQGKWHGVKYTTDTIVWDWNHEYFHHIIVRPSQKVPKDTTYYICEGDSVQLFWPKTQWIKHDTVYFDTVPMGYQWTDEKHGYTYNNQNYLCDSVTRWTVKFVHPEKKDTTAHRLLGDSIWWGGAWRYYTGVYDSIGPAKEKNSDSIPCRLEYTLKLYMDTAYYFRDTIELCTKANETHTYIWPETGHKQFYTVGTTDTVARHYKESLITYDRRDSIYDLCVNYSIIRDTLIFDTICEDTRYRFNSTHGTVERWIDKPGRYVDTLTALNGCDSIVTLQLYVRNRVPVTHTTVHIPDTAAPYLWQHTWSKNGLQKDSTQILSATGEYEFLMQSIYGCDSIDSLHLFIHPTYRIQEDSLIYCNDQTPITWQDRNDITKTGDYTFHALTQDGYDSIRYVHIEVLPILHTTILDTLCDGDSIRFGLTKLNQPRFLTQTGVYYDTLTSRQYGCDSIIELRLNVYPKFFNAYTRHIANTELPYIWEHKQGGTLIGSETLNAEGEYVYHFTTPFGCDSVDSLSLRVHQTYLYRDTVIICSSETPYEWEGIKDIYTTNEYIKHLQTHDGYDSTHVRYIQVLPVLRTMLIDTLCEGDSIRFGLTKLNQPRFLTQTGVYYDTLTSRQYGCDSIIELRLNVYPKYSHHEQVDIADTALPYAWKHIQGGNLVDTETLNGPGEYVYHFATPFGCDSVDSLSLRVHQTYRIKDDTIHICTDAIPYTWHSYTNITESGEYTYYGQTIEGYDSIHTVYIHVWPVQYTTLDAAICSGHSYTFDGQTLTEQGTYRDTLVSIHGCDSIVTLHLTVNKPYFNTRTEHIIEGQEVAFFDTICKTTGTYFHYGMTPTGCDSTTVLQLFVHKLVDTVATVCSTELPYQWVNKWTGSVTPLYTAGIYRNDTTFIDGERMFYGLQLVVNEPTDTTLYREICADGIYNFNGQFLTEAGEYRDTLRNHNGCDSVVILHLNVLQKYYHTVNHSIFEGDSVEFQGQYYSTAGTYPVLFTSSFGCDSIIELNLTVKRLYDDSVSVCANELPLQWRNRTIYESGIYRDTTYADGKEVITGIKVKVLPIFRAPEPTVVAICEGDFYKFGDAILSEQGTYYDTLTAVNGCDSIVMLSLQVMPSQYISNRERIFEGDSVEFNGQWLKESGVYERRETNSNGCTSTYQLILTVLKSFNIDTTAVVCDNELPFIWRGYEYNESGDYMLPISWTDSSRVVKTLHLTVNTALYSERNLSICAGDTIRFNGRQYYESGEFYDTIPSHVGCDSVIKYIVSVHPTFDRIFEKHISDKEPYIFHDRVLTQSGTFEWTGKSIHGCDSLEHLLLTVHPSFFRSDTVDLCQSDSENYPYVWKDENGRVIRTITQSGTYCDSVLTEYGFDSVHQVVVNIHPMYFTNEQYEIGDGEVLKIHGKDISKPAVYLDTLRTVHGCDSIFHIVVNAKRTREFTWNKTICQGDEFDFFGQKKTHTGHYTYVSQYKDSIVYLNLTVNPVTYSEKRIVITDKTTSYIYNGKLYDNLRIGENLFTETSTNQYECDSIHRLIICVTTRYSDWDPIPLCPGSEIKIDGDTITKSGLYTFVRRSRVTGEMDSLYRVEVYDAPAFDFPTEYRTICQGDSIEYAGQYFKKPGQFAIKYKTINGCDSVYHLDLTVNPTYYIEETVKVFDDEVPYTWENSNYYNTGDYYRTWQVKDCDSTRVLHLIVDEPTVIETSAAICNGDSLTWRGNYYMAAGDHYETIRDSVSRHKTTYILHLEVVYPTYILSATTTDICADEEQFDIQFEYNGAKPTNYSIYFDAHAKYEGFKDIINAPFESDMVAHVVLPQYPDIVYANHPYYVRPNKYTMRMALDNGICGQSISNDIEILVKYPSWIIEQHWDDVVAPLKKEYNGGFDFSEINWSVNGTMQPNNSHGYLHNDKLKTGDEVVMWAMRQGENYSIPTCPLVIKALENSTIDEPILVYPTQAPRHAPHITIKAPQGGTYAVYSSTGTFITDGELVAGSLQITLPSISGIYFIRTSQGNDTKTHKVLLY